MAAQTAIRPSLECPLSSSAAGVGTPLRDATPRRRFRRVRGACGIGWFAAACCAVTLSWTPTADAEPVSATGKGIVGGALLGAEVVVISEAVAGVDQRWLYLVGGLAGAAGGGVGGYFLESAAHPRVSVLMLMGGMALAIPSAIVYFDATRYRPPEYPDNRLIPGEPLADPPDPQAGPELTQALPLDSSPVLSLANASLQLNVPDVFIGEVFSRTERSLFALPNATDIQVALVSARF